MAVRISEIAAELGYSSKEIIEKAHEMGLKKIKAANSAVSLEEAENIYNYVQTGELPQQKSKPKTKEKKQEVVVELKQSAETEDKAEQKNKEPAEKIAKEEKATKVEKVTESEKVVKAPKEEIKKTEPKREEAKQPVVKKVAEPKREELKKEEPKQPVVKKAEKTAEPKREEIKKEEPKINTIKTIDNPMLGRRRGLVIVKKKQEEEEEKTPASVAKKQPNERLNLGLEEIFSNAETNLKKKKSTKKLQPVASKKDGVKKIEIDREMADTFIDDEDEVMLPDLTIKPIEVEESAKTKRQDYRTATQNKFINQESRSLSRGSRKKRKKVVKTEDSEAVSSVDIPKEIRVYEFADKLNKQPSEIISKLFMLGLMVTKNDFLDEDAIEILADEFNIEVNIVDAAEEFDYVTEYDNLEDDEKDLEPRAPVITIMGHVDHGKTSLLDYIRNSRVARGEAGGITQHVGAYMVEKNGRNITFIDTPGHEAFTAMRERGAEVTDIVIIIVAADDGVKMQTKEAVSHAKAAGVPIIVAINKMDKETANPDLVKTGLSELEIMPTEWGGSHDFVPISAKTGMGIDDLLEIVLLQADLLDLKANPKRDAKATVIESSLQKGLGTVATIIMQNGSLRVGDNVVAGIAHGRVRAIRDDQGNPIEVLKPGECGVIIGLSEVPEAGEILISVENEKEAREYAQKKYEYIRQKELSKSTKVSIEELSAKIAEGELKTLPVIVKADVGGSLEAIKASLANLRNEEVKVDIIHSGVGGITQNDVGLASASENCVILGFNVRPTGEVKERAKERGVEIKTYNVIYSLLDDVKSILGGLMSPIISEEELGQAEIREVINVPRIGQIAGCLVTDGHIVRGAKIRVIRDGVVKFEGNISSLRRFKDDVKEVAKGFECGVGIEGFDNMQVGDYIESFKEREQQASL
ncbi:MAG: translation initiation factor IF-2 [Campylobacteraceae bacterium]|nr:translation initiation factor IF-2 [Campylobacteraceae bacterium]